MKWISKAIVQKAISFLPANHRINYLFQKHITKGVSLSDEYFSNKLTSSIEHISAHHSRAQKGKAFEALELGTGWYPIVPISLFLAGAERIVSIDINPLLTHESILATIRKIKLSDEEGKLEELKSLISLERLDFLYSLLNFSGSFEELLDQINLEPEICDARKTSHPSGSFDLICSNNTFEHIPKKILSPILAEFQRLVKPGGTMSHFIDMSDHFAHMDRSISIYHFLRFSEKQWQLIDNSIQPQNRMRLRDYCEIYEENGIEIEKVETRKGDLETVASMPVHHDFQGYTKEELAISHALVIS